MSVGTLAEESDRRSAASDATLRLPRRRKMQILVAILMAHFLAALDQTIVGVSLPRIVGDLGGTNELYTWVVTSYLLAATISGVLYGKLSDIYGRRSMLLLGITVFIIGSILCGLAWSMESLVLFRGVQGFGAGAILPVSLAVIGDLFSPRERGRYTGLFGASFGIALVIGPLLGGLITDSFGWHWIFLVNLPVGAAALTVVYRYLPSISSRHLPHRLDYLGAVLFAIGVVLLLLGLTHMQTAGLERFEVGGYLLISAIVFGVFLIQERRAAEPIVALGLFRYRNYAVSILAGFLATMGFYGALFFMPRWFQFVQGVGPTESGFQTLALMAGVIISTVLTGILVSRTGRYRRVAVASLMVMVLGVALLTRLEARTELPVVWLGMFIVGVGFGPSLSIFTTVVQNAVPLSKLGVASGNLTFFRTIGGAVGLAIVGTLFADRFTSHLGEQLDVAGVSAQDAGTIARFSAESTDLTQVGDTDLGSRLAQLPELLGPVDPIVAGINQAFSLAIGNAFWFSVLASAVALLIVAVGLRELPLRRSSPAPNVQADAQRDQDPHAQSPGTPVEPTESISYDSLSR